MIGCGILPIANFVGKLTCYLGDGCDGDGRRHVPFTSRRERKIDRRGRGGPTRTRGREAAAPPPKATYHGAGRAPAGGRARARGAGGRGSWCNKSNSIFSSSSNSNCGSSCNFLSTTDGRRAKCEWASERASRRIRGENGDQSQIQDSRVNAKRQQSLTVTAT